MHSKGSSPRNNVSTSDYLPFYKVIKHEVFKLYLLSKSARDTINHSKNRMKFQSVAVVHDFLAKFPCDRSVPSVQCSSRTFLQHRFFLSFFSLSLNIMFIVRTSVHFFFVSLGSDVCMCRSFARICLLPAAL